MANGTGSKIIGALVLITIVLEAIFPGFLDGFMPGLAVGVIVVGSLIVGLLLMLGLNLRLLLAIAAGVIGLGALTGVSIVIPVFGPILTSFITNIGLAFLAIAIGIVIRVTWNILTGGVKAA